MQPHRQPNEILLADNPQIQALAKRLRWKSETAIRRIQSALPVPIEQEMYLEITAQFRIGVRPETFAELLRYFNNGQSLSPGDLQDRVLGPNLFSNKVARIGELLNQALSLREELEDMGFSISLQTTAPLALAYGDEVEEFIGLLADNLWQIAEELNIRPLPQQRVMAMLLKTIARHAAETEGQSGMPNPATPEEIIDLVSSLRIRKRWEEDKAEPDLHFFGSSPDRFESIERG